MKKHRDHDNLPNKSHVVEVPNCHTKKGVERTLNGGTSQTRTGARLFKGKCDLVRSCEQKGTREVGKIGKGSPSSRPKKKKKTSPKGC